MVGIYRLLFFVCPHDFGNGSRVWVDVGAMKFCSMVDLGVQQVISPFGELWPRG